VTDSGVPDVGPGRCALVGVAKNCGKTTTLNALARRQRELGRAVGLISIGVDGESRDALIGTPKPAVHIAQGEWVVSAASALSMSTARFELVGSMGYSTPMGEALLARATDAGEVVLAGVRHLEDLARAQQLLLEAGAEVVFIDGAYGRVTAARPDLCDRVVVATGAIVSPEVAGVVAATRALTSPLTWPRAEEGWRRELLDAALAQGRALVGGPSVAPRALSSPSALVALRRDRAVFGEGAQGIAIPGLVSDAVAERLIAAPSAPGGAPRALLVPDGTRVQLTRRLLGKLKRGWACRVGGAVELAAVSVNPSSVAGPGVPREALIGAMREAFGGEVPVFDPRALG
jgi:hypothetical protein